MRAVRIVFAFKVILTDSACGCEKSNSFREGSVLGVLDV